MEANYKADRGWKDSGLSLEAERIPMWGNSQRQFLTLDLAMLPLVICVLLSDTLRLFALFYSSHPTRAATEHAPEGAQSFLSKIGQFSLSGPELTRGRIHLILGAGATPPRPRLLPLS